MGRIAIFTDDPGWHGARLCEAFEQRGFIGSYVSLIDCRIFVDRTNLPVVIPGFESNLPDGVFVRGVPGGSLEQVVHYLDILHALKELDIPVYNDAGAIERSVDKSRTSFLLNRSGIPTPFTWVTTNHEEAINIANRELNAGHSLISKPVFGSQGEGLRRFENTNELAELESSNGVYYLQRFIQCASNSSHDWRVFVINGKAYSAMRRSGLNWLNNVAKGATCKYAILNNRLRQLAEAAVQALDMSYGGVDIICDREGHYSVIEVNSIPAWKGLQSVCNIDVAALLADDFLSDCQNSCLNQTA